MYNIDQVNLLIAYKEKQLNELKKNNSTSPSVQKIEEELKYLKLYEVRYKIAKIIGYDNNESYKSINYIGIEKEDFSKFNLSQSRKDELTNLIREIPSNDVDLFRTRLAIAKLLKQEDTDELKKANYEGVEDNNPYDPQFRLSSLEIQQFESLKSQIDNLKKSNGIKNLNINDITADTVEELFNRLNSLDSTSYSANKDEDLKSMFELMDSSYSKKEFINISNYEFAYDILKKYPTGSVKLQISEIEKLIDYLNSDPTLDNDQYNIYIKILSDNINVLMNDEKSKSNFDSILDKINKSNYSLRSDLSKNIKNDKLKLDSDELVDLITYLNDNYDSLSVEERDKLYNLLKEKLEIDANNLDTVDNVNKLISSINNVDFRERIRKDFDSNYRVQFSDKHVSSYSDLINSQVKALEKQKDRLLKKNSRVDALNVINLTKVKEIEKNIENLKKLDAEYDNNILIKGLDLGYNKSNEKVIEIEREIQNLTALREKLKSQYQMKSVDRQIKKLNNKITKIKKGQTKIVGMQKKIMMPKVWVMSRRGMIERHFDSKAEAYEDFASDYHEMAEANRNMSGMFNNIKAMMYDFKANKYTNKSELNRKIYDVLSKPGVKISLTGQNKKAINKNSLNNLKNKNAYTATI